MNNQTRYYIESFEEKNFNLWVKIGVLYYNRATLFYKDELCRDQWTVNDIGSSVSYSEKEIKDELEGILIEIPKEHAEQLLAMGDKTPEGVFDYVISILREENDKTR